MPQWEYCELRQEIASGILHDQYILFYSASNRSHRESFVDRDTAIARLGLEGWEMVGAVGGFDQGSSGFRLFFKRQLPEK
jgi:hypothetical protein